MDKKDLRRFIRMQKSMCSAEELNAMSATVIAQLLAHPRVKSAGTLLVYHSLDDEVNTHHLLDQLVAQGKRVLLPAVISDTEMELRCYEGPADLEGGFFNIMEPVGRVFTDYDAIEVAVVPGMAFDSRGHRLGRGKGYYDRLLPRLKNAYKIGICFGFQFVPGVPADEHDIMMDEIIK